MRLFGKPAPEPEPLSEVEESTHPTPDYVVPLAGTEPATATSDLFFNNSELALPYDRVWGWKDNIQHILRGGLTTICDIQTDRGAETRRLALPPHGMLCGACLRKV